ncbi:hypothetical protein ACYSNU_04930 [Enterococcus sp. LJL120]
MVVSKINNKLTNLKKKNEDLLTEYTEYTEEDLRQEKEHYSGLYVFASFDIVNSTQYKSIEQDWPNLIDAFYDRVASELKNRKSTESFNVWKYIGDEVLFYGKVTDAKQLVEIPRDVMITLNKTTKYIFGNFEESKGLLGLKSTIWCAEVVELEKDSNTKKRQNYLLKKLNSYLYETSFPMTVYDFLGPDIDAGFRLAKQCAKKNQVVVSAELAFLILSEINLLSDEDKILGLKKYRIMELVPLKGIWHERQYPVVWYREQWDQGVFEYDQNDDTYPFYRQNYLYSKEQAFDTFAHLSYIMSSVGKDELVSKFSYSINNSSQDKLESIHKPEMNDPVEVHLVAVTFNKDNQVIVLKRGPKKNDAGKFDFGCVNMTHTKCVKDSLTDYYSELFGISKEDYCILEDNQGNPIPIATYNYKKRNGNRVSGFIFTAKTEQEIQVDYNKLEKYEYDKYLFEDIDLEKLKKIDMYDNGAQNILKCWKMLNEQR